MAPRPPAVNALAPGASCSYYHFLMQQVATLAFSVAKIIKSLVDIDGYRFNFFFQPFAIRVRPDVNKIRNPSIMSTGNAHAVAKLYGILANGGSLGDKKLMSPSTVELQAQPIKSGKDKCISIPAIYGRGYNIHTTPKVN